MRSMPVLSTLTAAFLATTFAGMTPGPVQAQDQPAFETTRIADGVYRFRWQAHVGMFVVGDDGVSLGQPSRRVRSRGARRLCS